ncbi:hypothetical protein AAG570_013669 [Ranatra chinensis]|uniref:ATPase AAA-type core domain-containing protein n=1 Tax=Ranatra chinensis TaxID=642074 RepID=A0ABD0YCV0_9HEMI
MNIQRVWRGHVTRTKIRRRVVEEMVLIGMLRPPTTEMTHRQRANEVKDIRRNTREQYQQDYEKDIIIEKEKIKTSQGAKMMERMVDEVRTWFMSYRNQTGKFPDLPSEEAGGSAVIFTRGGTESERSTKSTAASSRKKSSSASKRGSREREEARKRKEEEEEDLGFKMSPSNFLADLMVAATEYQEVWKLMDETGNPQQRHYNAIIRQEKALDVEAELRKIVDVQLRAELEHLQAAADRDRLKKGKKPKKITKKKGRRTGKKGKKKKEKDLTPDRTVESLLEELVTNGIIKRCPQVPLSAFLGERSWGNGELRKGGKDPLPFLGDIRQVIMEYCILPMGSKAVHQVAPLVKSLLIVGPEGSGKRMLVQAVCTEIGAVLFDLTPANIVGKYPGKSGLIMLMHLVSKVSRLLQPSVIFIDGAEKTFMKKVPKTDRTDPKRLKKDLPKLVKFIGPEDQVILIGTSRSPWECDQKLLAQTYQKMIMIPKPDYASRSLVLSEYLFQYSALSREFNTSSLARISDGFTIGNILASLKDVLTCKRVLQLRLHQLTQAEIVNALCKYDPVYKEQEEAFLLWYSKTPISRRKIRAEEMEAERLLEKATKRKKLV